MRSRARKDLYIMDRHHTVFAELWLGDHLVGVHGANRLLTFLGKHFIFQSLKEIIIKTDIVTCQ